ncbi:hypothetical protein HPB50_022805 [Hyalomma asiaticum]|uniref:Uncharacterized protein n=1 Tax=Hyalomma asiaticum TaxID=266040 RepID=A0ACB7TM04_HYAAI|nr:hypothetical protein HPB50_022805 [Hyalomma asiaticum]
MPPEKSQLFTNAKKVITVDPIPRNIHPTHNEEQRKARAKAILDKIKHETKVPFVDAARYWNRGVYAVSVVDAHGSLVNAATVVTNFTHEAEEMAIAVALRSCTGASVIYSDSRTAIRTFSAALVSSRAAAVVNKLFCQERGEENFPSSHIALFPAHMGNISGPPDCNPNERAHQLARELTFRVCGPPPRFNTAWKNLDNKDPLVSYHELASSHRLGRQIFPPPHTKLNRAQAITYRQLQIQHVGEQFVSFLLDTIESVEVEEEVAELSLGTLLSLNLHLQSEADNFVLRTLATRKDARALTERLMLLVNREDDPARVLTHEVKGVPNSVLKMLAELFSDSTTAELFYLNDVAVLVDIVARQLSDLPPGDKMSAPLEVVVSAVPSVSGHLDDFGICHFSGHQHILLAQPVLEKSHITFGTTVTGKLDDLLTKFLTFCEVICPLAYSGLWHTVSTQKPSVRKAFGESRCANLLPSAAEM